ncbi:hypothetical protein EGW08_002582 [Elysia chlorotica]|uniref:TIR domain-containing protein n=1 Tax=Elysia chlorotica TaxID=188477 RepID=A0A3S1CDE3_ELYCH|nr:hypothetical protein EGW08_002582 [Elysia chlorotica]
MMHGGVYPSISFSSSGCSAELLEGNRSQPIPEGVASEWLNENSMVGASPYKAPQDHMTSNGYTLDKATYDTEGDLTVVESTNQQCIIYVSHTVRESDRVNPFIAALRKHFLTCTFETSALCVEMRDKKDSIARCEFVLLFMSDTYSESHEMAMEYSLFEGKKVLVAAHSEMHWPPGNYFKDKRKEMERCHMVKVNKSDNKADVEALINLVDAQLQESNKNKPMNGTTTNSKSGKGKSGGKSSPSSKSSQSPSKENSSSTCRIL